MADHAVDPHIQALKETMEKALLAIDQSLVIPLHRLCFRDQVLLGVGGFGLVRKATLDTDSNIVAVKQLYTSGDGEDRILQGIAFIRELKVWTQIEHPHIVRLLGFYWDAENDTALFISSYEPNGTLFRYLRNGDPSPDKRLELVSDTADGMTYLHELVPPICHGDLTSRNIVITADFRARICDFGLAKVIEDTSSGLTTETFHMKGAARYRGPELDLPGAHRTLKSDMWAWGCVAFEILTTIIPYCELKDSQVTPQNTKHKLPAALDDFDIETPIKKMLLRCWESEPKDRPEIRSCFNDISRARSRLQAQILFTGAAFPEPVDPEAVLHAQIDSTLESLSHMRVNDSWFGAGDRNRFYGGGLTDVEALVVVQPFKGFNFGDEIAAETMRMSLRDQGSEARLVWKTFQLLKQWSEWSHPNLVKLEAFYLKAENPVPRGLSHFAEHASLETYLKQEVLSQTDYIKLAIGTAKGLAYLHTRRLPICHRDISSANVVVDSLRRTKLCSFTLACVDGFTPEQDLYTLRYTAPERLIQDSEPITLKCDIWSWAALCAEIFGLGDPWRDATHYQIIREMYQNQKLPYSAQVLSTLPRPLMDLLLLCWQYDPDRRPDIQYCQNVLTQMFVDLC